jgi:hypothetical protein
MKPPIEIMDELRDWFDVYEALMVRAAIVLARKGSGQCNNNLASEIYDALDGKSEADYE